MIVAKIIIAILLLVVTAYVALDQFARMAMAYFLGNMAVAGWHLLAVIAAPIACITGLVLLV